MIYEMPAQHGWICPRCGQVLAPWVPKCDCQTPTVASSNMPITTGTTESSKKQGDYVQINYPDWWKKNGIDQNDLPHFIN